MSWYNPASWAKKGVGYAANPLIGSAMLGKDIVGGINGVMGRGYDKAQGYQNQIYDMYNNNKSNINSIYDPSLRKSQMSGLDQLMGIASNPNLDAQSQSELNQIRDKEGQLEKGSRGAIMQNANERGAGTSSGALLDQLTNSQSASERRTNQDTEVLANQQKRALDALYGSINTAGTINSEDMGRANALDLFNRYNMSGKAGALSNEGNLAMGKAGAENDFWSKIIGGGANMMAGNPSGAAGMFGGGGGGQNPMLFTDETMPSPWQSYYGGGWQK